MALDRSQIIRVYTNRLVKSLVPAEFGTEFIQSINNDLYHLLVSTTSSLTLQQKQQEIGQLSNQYKTFFLTNGKKHEWQIFQSLLNSLSKSKTPDQIYSYLVFFATLNQAEEEPQQQQQQREEINQFHRTLSPESEFEQVSQLSRTSADRGRHISSLPLSSPYKYSPPPLSARTFNTVTLDQLINPYYESLPEETILTYLSYTLQGLDSKLLTFQSNTQIELPSTINNSYSGLLVNILECALLYKNLAVFAEEQRGKLRSPIKTAYLTVLEEQLNLYVNHINDLFHQQPPSSLFIVYNAIFEWIASLRLLYTLVLGLNEINGYDFLSKIFELTKFGDKDVRDLSKNIFHKISVPYYEILEHWIINGELIDTSNEFFIQFDFNNNEFNEIIQFVPSRIPFFITKQLSYKIFQIGKILIFLTKYCKELKWINQYNNQYSQLILKTHQGLQNMTINTLNDIIDEQYHLLLNYLTVTLHGSRNQMFQHLANFKKFYLTQNSDFIEYIIFKGNELFNEPSTNISSNYLSKILLEAIQFSSIKYSNYASRLDARVLDPVHGNVGWEVFTIEYRIDDLAISTLFETQVIQYLKMFNFLWRLRHIQSLLSNNFIDSQNLKRNELHRIRYKFSKIRRSGGIDNNDQKVVWITKTFNTVNLIRNNFVKFLDSLVGYLSFDVIEDSYNTHIVEKLFKSNKVLNEQDDEFGCNNVLANILASLNSEFLDSLKGKTQASPISHNMNELTLDEIVKVHETYLNKIIDNKLINDNSVGKVTKSSYILQIYSILGVIFKFIKSSEEYYNLVIEYVTILNIESPDEEVRGDLDAIEANMQAIIGKIYKDIFIQEFRLQREDFVRDLKNDFELRNLSGIF